VSSVIFHVTLFAAGECGFDISATSLLLQWVFTEHVRAGRNRLPHSLEQGTEIQEHNIVIRHADGRAVLEW